jgi:hypothetical protein
LIQIGFDFGWMLILVEQRFSAALKDLLVCGFSR